MGTSIIQYTISSELVNEEGFHTKKIESLAANENKQPTYGRKKEHHSSYLAEFKQRYINTRKDLWKAFLKDTKKFLNSNKQNSARYKNMSEFD